MTILFPAGSTEDWRARLADPVKHWRSGYSAKTLAHAWQETQGFPAEVGRLLSQRFDDLEMLLGIPEHKVHLPGGGRPSQTDVWVLARSGTQLVSVAVEGKVSEPFGPTIEEWLADSSANKQNRLVGLNEILGCAGAPPGAIRYQLLHRTASALIEARRFCAPHAVMLVHSFSQADEWLPDYVAFGRFMGAEVDPDKLVRVRNCGGIDLYLGWVRGNPAYLNR